MLFKDRLPKFERAEFKLWQIKLCQCIANTNVLKFKLKRAGIIQTSAIQFLAANLWTLAAEGTVVSLFQVPEAPKLAYDSTFPAFST